MRVLVLESDVSIAERIKGLLAGVGYEVEVNTSGKQGLERVEKNNYAGLVLRVELPDVNGFVVCNKLKRDGNHSAIPIVAIYTDTPVKALKQHSQLPTHADSYLPLKAMNTKLTEKMVSLTGDPKVVEAEVVSPKAVSAKEAGESDDIDVDTLFSEKLGVRVGGEHKEKEEAHAAKEIAEAIAVEVAKTASELDSAVEAEVAEVVVQIEEAQPEKPHPFSEAEKLKMIDEITKLKNAILDAEQKNKELEQKISALENEKGELTQKLDELNKEKTAVEDKVKELETVVKSASGSGDEKAALISKLEDELKANEGMLQEKDNKIKMLAEKLSFLTNSTHDLFAEIENLKKAISD